MRLAKKNVILSEWNESKDPEHIQEILTVKSGDLFF